MLEKFKNNKLDRNENVIQQCEQSIVESEKSLKLLNDEMTRLQIRRFQNTGIPIEKEYQKLDIPLLQAPETHSSISSLKPPGSFQNSQRSSMASRSQSSIKNFFDILTNRSRSNSDVALSASNSDYLNNPPSNEGATYPEALTDFGN